MIMNSFILAICRDTTVAYTPYFILYGRRVAVATTMGMATTPRTRGRGCGARSEAEGRMGYAHAHACVRKRL
jgi:hypothetical protein